jgi:hypothetical protein
MTERDWADDDVLLADLQEALASSAADSEATAQAGYAAFTWRTVDDELAALTYDSLVDDRVLVRSPVAAPRRLVFGAGETSLELELTGDRVTGQLVPAAPAEVVVVTGATEVTRTGADDAGLFTTTVPRGVPFRLRCTTASGTFATDWVRL